MELLTRYLRCIKRIEALFTGLPHSHTTLIKSLISSADPKSGLVTNLTYYDLSLLLEVRPAPGRKGAGKPSKETIRNYIKSIEHTCGEYFQVITEGQKLKFKFSLLPKIYKEEFCDAEINTGSTYLEAFEDKEQNSMFESKDNTEVNIELNTSSEPVKNIINNINNNNNNKQSISENFTPNTETLARAEALGYSNASDFSEIQAFIDYNKATGSQFVDFNPIYLRWLAKSVERQQQKQLGTTGSINHAKQYSLRTQTHQPSLRERVLKAHAGDFALCEDTEYFESNQQNNWNYGAFVVEVN